MAIATLERCYNNYNVFTGVVKIRKGEAVRLMMEATSLNKVKAIMTHFTTSVSMCKNDDMVVEKGSPFLLISSYHLNTKLN